VIHVTCGLTACTPGSAPGPTLVNEYGKTLPFYLLTSVKRQWLISRMKSHKFICKFVSAECRGQNLKLKVESKTKEIMHFKA